MSEIPKIGYGTWPLKDKQAEEGVLMALELGYRHIDTARMYQNEREVGAALAQASLPREEIFLTTKIWPSDFPADRFFAAAKESCEVLQTVPDLLLLHWPPKDGILDDVVDQLVKAQDEGFAKHVGVSNFDAGQLEFAHQRHPGRILCNQIEFHPFLDQREVMSKATEFDIDIVAYCPLARGKVLQEKTITEIAARTGKSAAAVALRWALDLGAIVIPKSGSRERAADNLTCMDCQLTDDDRAAISSLMSLDGSVL